jgi:hypothetical protein
MSIGEIISQVRPGRKRTLWGRQRLSPFEGVLAPEEEISKNAVK